jgi:hypothetical protein
MSRIGKIARLPSAVRDELNRRLRDGERGNRLVAWLNGHPQVQAVLTAQFGGRAINEPNLTAWRQGGYAEWWQDQEVLELAGRFVKDPAAVLGALAARGANGADRPPSGAGGKLNSIKPQLDPVKPD